MAIPYVWTARWFRRLQRHNIEPDRSFFAKPKAAGLTRIERLWYLSEDISGATVTDTMGTFRIDFELENPMHPGERRTVRNALVDTGAELSWIPADILESLAIERYTTARFRSANGTVMERWTGTAWIHVGQKRTADDVVFGEPDDMIILGARSLEGLNLRIEPANKKLVDAGPAPAAATA
jgi:predicted aspartyl protease